MNAIDVFTVFYRTINAVVQHDFRTRYHYAFYYYYYYTKCCAGFNRTVKTISHETTTTCRTDLNANFAAISCVLRGLRVMRTTRN